MNMQEGMPLADKIRRARLRRGYTQQSLADELGIDPSSVYQWEVLGRVPRPAIRRKLWELLELTPDDFDPPPGGGSRSRRRRTDHRAHQGTAVAQGPSLADLVAMAVNALASYVPLEMQRDMVKTISDGIRALEVDGQHERAEYMRRVLTDPAHRTEKSAWLLAYAVFARFLANPDKAKAGQEVEDVAHTIQALAA